MNRYVVLARFLIRSARWRLLVAVALGVVSGVGTAALISSVRTLLDAYSTDALTRYALLCAGVLAASTGAQLVLFHIASAASYDLRTQLSERVLETPLREVEGMGSARLLAVLTEDVSSLATALSAAPVFVTNLAVIVSTLAYLAWLSWRGLLVLLASSLVMAFVLALPLAFSRKRLERARSDQDAMFGHFRAVTEGAKELKLRRKRRDAFLHMGLRRSAEAFRRNAFAANSWAVLGVTGSAFQLFAVIGVLVFLSRRTPLLPADALPAFVLSLIYLFGPLQSAFLFQRTAQQAVVALGRAEELGALGSEHRRTAYAPLPVDGDWSRIELSGVTHQYRSERDDATFTLGPVDIEIRRGEITFIVGGNGSGKSTLVKLLTGLYVPERGTIRVDKTVVDEDSREWYRQYFSAVFADFFLFDDLGGLGGNVAPRAARYLARLQLEHKVRVVDGVLSTTKLSQGQRRRLALLLAYLDDAPVYVFDEWASDQDPVFKRLFYTELLPELKAQGKAVVCVTHDERYFHVADQTIKLEDGRVLDEETSHFLQRIGVMR
ncbi:MAG TPA: cyclic peptide export ABC transporter [Minicystis sp.]|nr:cyclic peptide export ABC transporter [Minicystis sp.]